MRLLLAILWLPLLVGSAQAQPGIERISPPPNVNMQIEGTSVLQDGACVTYYKTRDRGVSGGRPSRGDLVWKIDGGQSIVVLEPGRSVTDGNGTLAVENGIGYLFVVDKSNGLLKIPIPDWVSTVGANECSAP